MLSLRNSEGKYASVLSKETDCTYTHILKILNQLHKNKLVEFEKEGRIKRVTLTPAGEEVAHDLEGLIRRLEKPMEEVEKAEEKKG